MTAQPFLASIEPVERRTVSAGVRDRLLDAVRSGELVPGQPVPSERALCEQFGVARTSVREAIQGLVSAGVLERRGNRTLVAERLPTVKLDGDDRKHMVRQLFEVRRVLEPQMAGLTALRASDGERSRINEIAARNPRQLDEFRATDREFHSALAHGCANPVLTELHAKALASLFGSGEFASLLYAEANRREVGIIRSATDAHRAIACGIVNGDVKRTIAAVETHLADIERRMIERLV
jgi:GntR family transcriptional regulator, transcriptional repressor for pyruvate dehydrogenase complex